MGHTRRASRYDQCDETCTTDCGHCKGDGQPGNRYWNGHDAILGLIAATRTVERIEADKGKYTWSLPPSVENERDEAVAQAADAIRFLLGSV